MITLCPAVIDLGTGPTRYVFRHFQTSAFTQMENMSGRSSNPPENIAGAWTGSRIRTNQEI